MFLVLLALFPPHCQQPPIGKHIPSVIRPAICPSNTHISRNKTMSAVPWRGVESAGFRVVLSWPLWCLHPEAHTNVPFELLVQRWFQNSLNDFKAWRQIADCREVRPYFHKAVLFTTSWEGAQWLVFQTFTKWNPLWWPHFKAESNILSALVFILHLASSCVAERFRWNNL